MIENQPQSSGNSPANREKGQGRSRSELYYPGYGWGSLLLWSVIEAVCPQNIWERNTHLLRDTFSLRGLYTKRLQILNSPHLKGLLLDPFSSADLQTVSLTAVLNNSDPLSEGERAHVQRLFQRAGAGFSPPVLFGQKVQFAGGVPTVEQLQEAFATE